MIELNCTLCNKPYLTHAAWIKKNKNGRGFCSKKCAYEFNKPQVLKRLNEKLQEFKEKGGVAGRRSIKIVFICPVCNKSKLVSPSENKKSCSFICRSKLKTKRKYHKKPNLSGEKHYKWKGGEQNPTLILRGTLEYRIWRQTVFERDKFTCVFCGTKNKTGVRVIIQADHIKPLSLYPELAFDIENGRTLCKPCHMKQTHGA